MSIHRALPARPNRISKARISTSAAFSICACLLLGASVASAFAGSTLGWRNVCIGGGGAVTGVEADPNVKGLFYIQTDIGGAYRWDSTNSKWIPITELRSTEEFGISSLTVDPAVANKLYILTGKYIWDTPTLLQSTDAGDTWTKKAIPAGVKVQSNGADHGKRGPRLTVDPNNSSVLYLASENVGLYRSVNGAGTWGSKLVSSGTTPVGGSGGKVNFVVFDKGGKLSGSSSAIGFAGVWDTSDASTGGVWRTTDGGGTWTQMTGGLYRPGRGAVGPDGTFYVTFNSGTDGNLTQSGTTGGVYKAARGETALTNITPETAVPLNWLGLTVDPSPGSHTVYVAEWGGFSSKLFGSTNNGKNWTPLGTVHGAGNRASRDGSAWFGSVTLNVNPFDPKEMWVADLVGVLRTPDVTKNTAPWDYLYKGLEEVVPLILRSAPSGAALLSGVADVGGERHENVDLYQPTINSFIYSAKPMAFGATTGLDFCEADPNVWARAVDLYYTGSPGYSSIDNGRTWQAFGSLPTGARGGRIAVSATNSKNFVWTLENGLTYFTMDRGASWTKAAGAPTNSSGEFSQQSQFLASDRVTDGKFYLYKDVGESPTGHAQIFRSEDGGATWNAVGTCPYPTDKKNLNKMKVFTKPGVAGEVWVDIALGGVYKSTDAGATFTKVPNIGSSTMMAFGKEAPGHTNPAIFLKGSVSGTNGIFRSDDDGSTWISIGDPAHPINDAPQILEADRQTFGRCYIGGDGRGIYVGDSAPTGTTRIGTKAPNP